VVVDGLVLRRVVDVDVADVVNGDIGGVIIDGLDE
jgi:hypothetical protein